MKSNSPSAPARSDDKQADGFSFVSLDMAPWATTAPPTHNEALSMSLRNRSKEGRPSSATPAGTGAAKSPSPANGRGTPPSRASAGSALHSHPAGAATPPPHPYPPSSAGSSPPPGISASDIALMAYRASTTNASISQSGAIPSGPMQPQSEGTVSEAGTSTSAVATAAALGHDLTFSPQLVITPTISPEAISVARHEAAAPPPQPVALAASSNFKHLPAVVHDNTDEPKPVLTITPAHLPSQPPAAAPTTPRRSLATRTSMPHYLHQLQQQQQRPPEQPPTCVTGSHVHLRPSGVVAGGGGAGMGDPWDQYFSPPASPMVLPRRRTGPYLRPDPVEELLSSYHTTRALAPRLAERLQRHSLAASSQLGQGAAGSLSAQHAQDAMLAGPGGAQLTRGSTPPLQSRSGRWASAGQRRKHGAQPPYMRFLGPNVMSDGIYLASGDYDFAGSRPLRSDSDGGLLFERYGKADDGALPPVQRYYFRPNKAPTQAPATPTPPPPPPPQQPPSIPSAVPPVKLLPNGIPTSRLQRMRDVHDASAARAREIMGLSAGMANQPPQPLGGGAPDNYNYSMVRSGHGNGTGVSTDAGPVAVADESGPFSSLAALNALPSPQLIGDPSAPDGGAMAALGAAGALGPSTAEPLLDPAFYSLVASHFDDLAQAQTANLQRKLNSGLPALLGAFGCSASFT